MGKILIMPSMGLPYFDLLIRSVDNLGFQCQKSSVFPRRGILWGKKITAIHLHMLDRIFSSDAYLTFIIKSLWFKFAIIPILKLRNIRIIWTCHEIHAHELDRFDIAGHMCKIVGNASDNIIVHSNDVKNRLIEMFPNFLNKIIFVHHGELTSFYSKYELKIINNENKKFMISSIGYMRQNKGNDLILKSFSKIDNKDIRLKMIGNCQDVKFRSSLEQIAESDERISLDFIDLSDEEVVEYHLNSDVIVFAFRECSTSGSVITAMSLDKAVIAPRIGHVVDLVNDDRGWTFSPAESEEGLRSAMIDATIHRQDCVKKGYAAGSFIRRQNWDDIGSLMANIYLGKISKSSIQ